MYKVIKHIYFVVLALCVVYMLGALLFCKDARISHVKTTVTQVVEPSEERLLDDSTKEYILDLEGLEDGVSLTLKFFTTHEYVYVYVGDNLIYSLYENDFIFGHSTGSTINFVEIPEKTTSVRVVLQSVFGGAKEAPVFYYGDPFVLYQEILKATFLDTALSIVIVVLGILLIIYWLAVHRNLGQNPSLAYFGLFSLLVGLWTLNETDLSRLIITNRTVASLLSYVLLSVMVVPFNQFLRLFFEKEKSLMCDFICAIAVVETFVLTMLQISGIREYKQTVGLLHGMLVLSLGYMAFCTVERIIRKGMDRKVRANMMAIMALMVACITDLYAYYTDMQQTDLLGKLGFLFYVSILGRESAVETFRMIHEGEKAQSYLKMAITDVMTGLLNRSAFEEWEDNCEDFNDVMIVTFDLNNLKYCNDNLGHAAGDEYIIEAANMIQRVFGAVGQCYRIGGDEFCAIIRRASHLKIEKYLDLLREEQDSFNQKSGQLKVHIAVGYAVHEESDADMEETRSRADVCMYRNKKQLKENGER